MKYLLVSIGLMASVAFANGQTVAGVYSSKNGKSGVQTKRKTNRSTGSGLHYGSKDTTPGSPMGTGGAGGSDMSGSQQGSALETAEHRSSTNKVSVASHTRKSVSKKKSTGRHNQSL